jgi:hypothetical protein
VVAQGGSIFLVQEMLVSIYQEPEGSGASNGTRNGRILSDLVSFYLLISGPALRSPLSTSPGAQVVGEEKKARQVKLVARRA